MMGIRISNLQWAGLASAFVVAATALQASGATPSQSIVIENAGPHYLGDPPVPRPAATPCVVTLFSDVRLNVDNEWRQAYDYTPPPGCRGPWLKVVLEADYAFDPYGGPGPSSPGAVWLQGSLLQWGGQANGNDYGNSGHFERDITDYTALLRRAGSGHVVLDSAFAVPFLTDDVYMLASARILIYPAVGTSTVPRKPDAVYALTRGLAVDQTTSLEPGQTALTTTLTLPRNIERAYLDVLTFGSHGYFGTDGDTMWWSCMPSGVFLPLLEPRFAQQDDVGACARGTFREAEVSIDGQAAGVAPIQPWLNRTGMNQFALIPEPAHSQNLAPYRVDLTPFAGLLSDGTLHTVSVEVVGGGTAGDEVAFNAAASLLVYRDAGSTQVTGGITRNTLQGSTPVPQVDDTLVDSGDKVEGDVTTTLQRQYVIEGFVDTSRGRIRNRVAETVDFSDTQHFNNYSNVNQYRYLQDVQLHSSLHRTSSSWAGAARVRNDTETFSYPLSAFYREQDIVPNGQRIHQTTANIRQGVHQSGSHNRQGTTSYTDRLDVQSDSATDRSVDDSGQVLDQSFEGLRHWSFTDNRGSCYSTDLSASFTPEVKYSSGASCPGGRNAVRWFAHTDGSPESMGWLEAR